MKKPFALAVLLGLMLLYTQAQLTEQKKVYTEADTLRGSLNSFRTCYDVTHYNLRVVVDTATKSIKGENIISYSAVSDFKVLQLDLFDNMKIERITDSGLPVAYKRKYNAIFVEYPKVVTKGERRAIKVEYSGQPVIAKRPPWDSGFVWTKDEAGNPWIAVSCEGIGASLWWPNKDHLSDEPDSMDIHCNVPIGLMAVCNGALKSADTLAQTVTWNWHVSYPINNYNVTLNIGSYTQFSDEYTANDGEKLALDYYVMPYNLDKAHKQFEQVKPMLRCYENYLGKYPFWKDGYALVETPYLGMEHQGAIAYGNQYKTGYAGRDFSRIGLSFDYIIIHETGHEWWGNSVSCSDIADMWIHESFCTYTEAIYVECMFDSITALKYINAKKATVDNKAPIVGKYGVNEEGDGDMYNKGMLFLNTLRYAVNNDMLWWKLIKTMSDTTFKMRNTNYEEIVKYFEMGTGMPLQPIFDQYLKHADLPVLLYKLKKRSRNNYALTIQWKTDVDGFKMNAHYFDGKAHKSVMAGNKAQTYNIQLTRESDFRINDDVMYVNVSRKVK